MTEKLKHFTIGEVASALRVKEWQVRKLLNITGSSLDENELDPEELVGSDVLEALGQLLDDAIDNDSFSWGKVRRSLMQVARRVEGSFVD